MTECWNGLCEKLAGLCQTREQPSNESTHLTVKCQNRYVSDENLLEAGSNSVSQDSSRRGSRSDTTEPYDPLSRYSLAASSESLASTRHPLSASENQLYRTPTAAAGRRSNTIVYSHNVPAAASQPSWDGADQTSGAPHSCTRFQTKSDKWPNSGSPDRDEQMKHAQTIADISSLSVRQLRLRNKAGRQGRWTGSRTRLLDSRESTGSLMTPDTAAEAAEVAQLADTAPDDTRIEDDTHGRVVLTVSYSPHAKKLLVHLESVIGLPTKGNSSGYSVVTELALLPDEKTVKQTPVVHGDLSPSYNIEWALPLKAREMRSRTLRVSVWEEGRRDGHDVVGHALLPLGGMVTETPERYILSVQQRSQYTASAGRLLVTTTYRPVEDTLVVIVHRARQLRAPEASRGLASKSLEKNAKYDTSVKVSLRCGGEKVRTRRGAVVAGTRDPEYNARFSFVVPAGFLEDTRLVASVTLRTALRGQVVLGRVLIGPYQRQHAHRPTHWGRTVSQPTRPVTQWHNLYL